MRKKLLTSLIGIIAVAAALLITNIAVGYKPALGLDLQGGSSVTLRPVQGQPYDKRTLSLAVERIRERIDAFGVGEPEIFQQDDAIVVNLPGVNDQKQALDLVSVTGKVYLRPVLQCRFNPAALVASTATSTSVTQTSLVTVGSQPPATGSTPASASSSPGPTRLVHPQVGPTIPPDTTVPDTAETTTTIAVTTTVDTTPVVTNADGVPVTVPILSDPTTFQELPDRDKQLCTVGPSPAGATGEIFERDSARPRVSQGAYAVSLKLNDGGLAIWNQLASECFNRAQSCPTGQLAIELDGEIQTHPNVNQPNFTSGVEITGNFTKGQAQKLSDVINSGALPLTLATEAVQKVSASLGSDSLRAAVIAGIIGVGLVLLLMVLYYKRLALVVIAGLCVSGALIYSVTALMSRFYGGVLSLSGIAGIIVSIGVTIDSYVVFFERLKDELRSGRTLRNSAQRGFTGAWRTIVVADCASLIGAAVLWYLTVGSVRGFAFYLGLSTLTDLFVAYFFTRPAILLLARSTFMRGKKILGIDTNDSSNTLAGALS
jgi:preprotein translocase subunit SecD